MVNADSNRGQPKPHRRNAASRGARNSIWHQPVRGIGAIPKVSKMRSLDIFQEFVVIRKIMRNGGDGGRWEAFFQISCQSGDPVNAGLSIRDGEIAEARGLYGGDG